MGIESAAAVIDVAGVINEAVRMKKGRAELDAASAQPFMSIKLLLPNAWSSAAGGYDRSERSELQQPCSVSFSAALDTVFGPTSGIAAPAGARPRRRGVADGAPRTARRGTRSGTARARGSC